MINLTVSEVNRIIKYKIQEISEFKSVSVMGEITNFNERNRFSHWYFNLKDSNSRISCNMFTGYQNNVNFVPENGMKVICSGYIDVYEKSGIYQLYVTSMQEAGKGDSGQALELLKKKLTEEGLFDVSHKKKLPVYPRKIGIVTSSTGAAVEDLKSNISRRWGLSEIVIAPCLVQGDKAPSDIVKSICLLDSVDEVDVIIVGRGGGSDDDLNAFNSEAVVRAVYNCKTPVISAVGHEVDFTLCDAAADLRVPTPSTAAEVVVPDRNEEFRRIDDLYSSIRDKALIKTERGLSYISNLTILHNRNLFFDKLEKSINDYKQKIDFYCNERIKAETYRLNSVTDKLNALSPAGILKRGYSITTVNGKTVNTVDSLKVNDNVEIFFKDGKAKAVINEVIGNGK